MLYVVAKLDNPFVSSQHLPALRVGQFLRAKIEGTQLMDVYAIPRRAVSQSNMIAVAEKGLLQKRLIKPLWTDAKSVVISASSGVSGVINYGGVINSTDQLILTPTANLASGTRVKSLNDNEDTLPVVNQMSVNSSTSTIK
jgi:hypothetical protein